MAFNANTANLAGWLAVAPLYGLPAKNFVPQSLWSLAGTVAARHIPPGAPPNFVIACQADLIARGIIYWQTNYVPCGKVAPVAPNELTTGVEGSAIAGISAMAGAALPGIGSFISAITGIFGAAHAQAVAKEQSTICQVAGVLNQAFAYYDAKVKSGLLSPSSAYAGMQSFLAQVNEQLQTIEEKCNAACVYQGHLAAHADFCQSYYPAIAPFSFLSGSPGGVQLSGGVPGGIARAGEALIELPFEKLGLSGNSALLAGLAALVILFVILFTAVT